MTTCFFSIAVLCMATAQGAAVIEAISFDTSAFSANGGFYTCTGSRPDKLQDSLITAGDPACGAWRLQLSADAPAKGVGGTISLVDSRRAGKPVDITGQTHLYLRVLGEPGGRTLRVELIPEGGEGVSVSLGTLSSGELDGSTWQVKGFSLNESGLKTASEIRVTAEGEGKAWFALNAAWFGGSGDGSRKALPAAPKKPIRKAMWVWKSKDILAGKMSSEHLLSFCKEQAITDIFWQLPNRKLENGKRGFWYIDEQRAFNAAVHRAGIRMHALDGDPEFVWRKNHHKVLEIVEAIARFNGECEPQERYVAVHMDNEPYVLKEWKAGFEAQQEIIRDYLDLNRELRRKVNAAGMEYGVDIPFWWDSVDGKGRRVYYLQTDSGQKPLLEAIFEIVQNAGIMSYRVRATGRNGVIDCCLTEFDLGQRMGVDVFSSVETSVGERVEKGITFGVYSGEYLLSQLDTLERLLAYQKGCVGMAIHDYYSFAGMLEKQR